jgi:hypothetical protein
LKKFVTLLRRIVPVYPPAAREFAEALTVKVTVVPEVVTVPEVDDGVSQSGT